MVRTSSEGINLSFFGVALTDSVLSAGADKACLDSMTFKTSKLSSTIWFFVATRSGIAYAIPAAIIRIITVAESFLLFIAITLLMKYLQEQISFFALKSTSHMALSSPWRHAFFADTVKDVSFSEKCVTLDSAHH